MTDASKFIPIKDGLSQQERPFFALADDYFCIDNRSLPELIDLAQKLYRQTPFFDGEDQEPKSWDFLFQKKEISVMAQIMVLPIKKYENSFHQLSQHHQDPRHFLYTSSFGPIGLLQKMDQWLLQISYAESSYGVKLRNVLLSILHGLKPAISSLTNIQQFSFSPSFLSHIIEKQNEYNSWNEQSCFVAIVQAVQMLQNDVIQLFPEVLKSGKNEPALSLIIVFLQLYQRLQKKMNQITFRRADFYLKKVLQCAPLQAQGDLTHLIIPLSGDSDDLLIKKGTQFAGPQNEEGQEIVFESTEDVYLSAAKITNIHTLYYPSTKSHTQQACWLDTVPVITPEAVIQAENYNPKPLFGCTRNGIKPKTAVHGRIGFAFADSVLYLKEGLRIITIHIQYDSQSCSETFFSNEQEKNKDLAQQKQNFLKQFSDLFHIELTTSSGWFKIKEYLPAFWATDESVPLNTLAIQIQLKPENDAIVGYSPEVHGEDYSTQLPVIRFILNQQIKTIPYAFLQTLRIAQVRITTEVQECTDLILHNQIGELSPLSPFQPFGPLPDQSSYLLVGCQELITKNLKNLSLSIHWDGLPNHTANFRDWYEHYSNPPENSNIIANLEILSNGYWQPTRSEQPVKQQLFQAESPYNIKEVTQIHFDPVLHFFRPQRTRFIYNDIHYQPNYKNGLFRLSLRGTNTNFGHQQYPQLLAKIMTYNAMVKNEHLAKKLPNPPYTPTISSIRLNYQASSTIIPHQEPSQKNNLYHRKMIYLLPMGWLDVNQQRSTSVMQIDPITEPGALYFSIQSLHKPKKISLYFNLHRDSKPIDSDKEPSIRWHILNTCGWEELSPQNIIQDTTNHFMTSGHITLQFPDTMSNQSTIMPTGLYWIKISAQKHLDYFCRLYSIFAQAIEVIRKNQLGEAPLSTGSIERTKHLIPGITEIYQIEKTQGGRSQENDSQMRTRIAERIHHKNRALNPGDYERLILQKFPEVYKVRCFASADPEKPNQRVPGCLHIVPIPFLSDDARFDPHLSGFLLQQIHLFCKDLAPDYSKITVGNPFYEKIQIRCGVLFHSSENNGASIQELNKMICRFLSPWNSQGYSQHFGWKITEHEIQAYIQNLHFIDSITDFSMLKIQPYEKQFFGIEDSENQTDAPGSNGVFQGSVPWSIAIPMKTHFINPLSIRQNIQAEVTGYGELEIGSTFILTERKTHGKNQ